MSYHTESKGRIHPSYVFLSEEIEMARKALSNNSSFTPETKQEDQERPQAKPVELSSEQLGDVAFKIFKAGARISRISLIMGLIIIIFQAYLFFLLSGVHSKVQSLEGQVIGDFHDYPGGYSKISLKRRVLHRS